MINEEFENEEQSKQMDIPVVSKRIKKMEFTTGYDSDIKFFFKITKLHGLETAFFSHLFSVRYKKQKSANGFNVFGLKFIYWGKKHKDTYLSVDIKKTRYLFGLRKFKYYGTSNIVDLV